MNHPNRSRAWANPARNPSPAEIRAARLAANLTQREAGATVMASEKSWRKWEAGVARMHPGLWALWLLTGPTRQNIGNPSLSTIDTPRITG